MLYLLDKDAKTAKWNGTPLHEASSAIVKEIVNGDFVLNVRYPITDSGIYQLIKEDMLIKAPTPVLGPQLFRIKKPIENDDSLDITAYHISDDVMQRSIRPVSVVGQGCAMALSQMVQNAKTDLGTFSFTSDIMDSRTFNTTETETLYSVLLDGKHSIVSTWEGELVRDNFALTIKRRRGADRGVVITTHKNLKSYQRTKNSQSVVTRIHAKSTFKAEGAEEETTINVTVDSPLIGNYPYINEKDYENNNAKTTEELRKWAEAKFTNEGIDKVSDAIEIEAYELDGQVVHLGDTVNIKSRKHDVDLYKKAIAYEYNALTEEYISITFDDKPGVGGSGVSSGVANAADVILSANRNAQEVAIERAVKNANQAFDAEFDKRVEVINDGIEQAKAEAELYADSIKQNIDAEIDAVNSSMQAQSEAHDRQVADILSKTQSIETLANQAKSDAASAITRANQVKTEAIADARAQVATVSQALNTAKTDLQNQVNAVDAKAVKVQADADSLRIDLNQQAQTILAQAQAQTALTSRVTTVETLADGTKMTVAELSKTVSKATGDIASVTSRTKTVEDTLSQTRTQYDALSQTVNTQTGQITSINQKTAQLQSGIDGVTARFESLKIGNRNYFKNSKSRKYYTTSLATQDLRTFIEDEFWQNDTRFVKDYVRMSFDIAFNPALASDFTTNIHFGASPWYSCGSITFKGGTTELQHFDLKFNLSGATSVYKTDNIFIRLTNAIPLNTAVSLENFNLYLSAVIEDYSQNSADLESKIAEYKQTADQNYAGLQSTVSTLDGKVTQNKTEANQTATQLSNRLTSVEAYKDGESTRSQAYFEASKTETARQITAERTAISANYVAKSTYDENVSGTTLKLNEIKTTADTTKQNLSTYQNTVDRKLEELTSSTQTLDGKINTASAKVDTVAGQIRTEISNVEGKIPTEIERQNLYSVSKSSPGYLQANGSTSLGTQNAVFNEFSSCYIEVADGQKYAFQLWVTVPTGNYLWRACQFYDSNKQILGGRPTWNEQKDGYQVAQHLLTVPPNAKYLRVSARLYNDGKIKLEKNNIFNDWVPSLEDLNYDVKSAKTILTQTSQGVEQLTNSLATTNGKVTTAETKIQQLISDVSSKVSQTDYNTLTGRVSSAETAITQNATEISKRLTSTQVNQAILADKQIKDTRSDNQSPQWYWTNYPKQTVEEFKASAVIGLTSESTYAILTTNVQWGDSSGGKVKQTAKTDRATFERYGTGSTWDAWTKIANAGDLANYTTKTEFQIVKETTSLYERVIGSTEVNVKDKIARIVMADSLFMTEVKKKVDGTSTQVTQLADSYAIKNLTNSGTVLNQLNLNKDGSVKIDGKLVQITGTTYIQDGVISSAKIASLDAGKITTGTLNAARIATNSITGSHIAFDQAFFNSFMANEAYLKQIFAKNAFITSVQAVAISASQISSGIIKATNGAMVIDLDNALTEYKERATIRFHSAGNVLYREKIHPLGHNTIGALMFKDSNGGGIMTALGNTSHQTIDTMRNNYGEGGLTGSFAGVRVVRDNADTQRDRVDIIADRIIMAHSTNFQETTNSGFYFYPTAVNGWWNLGAILQNISNKFNEHGWGKIGDIYNLGYAGETTPSQYT